MTLQALSADLNETFCASTHWGDTHEVALCCTLLAIVSGVKAGSALPIARSAPVIECIELASS